MNKTFSNGDWRARSWLTIASPVWVKTPEGPAQLGATLNATGDENQPIVFTANLTRTSQWGGIRLNYTSRNVKIFLNYVYISYALYGFMAYPDPWQTMDFT